MLAAGRAPSRWSSVSARRSPGSSLAPASASAASYGHPIMAHDSAARAHSPAISSAYGSSRVTGTAAGRPARHRQYTKAVVYGEFFETENSKAASVAAATASLRPSSQAASARAIATGAIH